jgi:tRNA wybutosine-synthesizing protein 1
MQTSKILCEHTKNSPTLSPTLSPMLSEQARQNLIKQHYKIIGTHSAVKTCTWTKHMIRGQGGCYKLTFYGIMSHQCMQMTTSISCANRCTFCWRDYKAPISKEWRWPVDEPQTIFTDSIKAHNSLLTGFGDRTGMSKKLWEQAKTVKHVALSLTGEPIIYPRINELIDIFHANGISTFLVTNAQYPLQIKELNPVTQLYISVDAPNKELMKQIDVPLFEDFWERHLDSLTYLSQKTYRTAIRLTLIKGLNDVDLPGYAQLINRGNPHFIEIKGYMYVGASRERLEKHHMPLHEDVIAFAQQLIQLLPEYDIVSEHIASRVVMFAKKSFCINGSWNTWIDFDAFHKLCSEHKPLIAHEYIRSTPKIGISGRGTKDLLALYEKRKSLKALEKQKNEKTLVN